MSDNSLELQKAIVLAFRADAAIGALAGDRIYDLVPQPVTFPYVSFGPSQGEPYDGVAMDGWECVIELHTWSRSGANNRVECQSIMAGVEALLHDQSLTLEAANFVNGRMTSSRTFADPDGITFRGVQRFRFVTGTA